MKILLCGEGQHEFGAAQVWDARSKTYASTEGWMQVLLRALRDEELEFEIRSRKQIQLLGKNPFRPALDGHGDKARLARFLADQEGFDAVIFMADCDSPEPRRWREIVGHIQAGFDDVEDRVDTMAAPCVPMSASESWVLSDEGAWAAVGLAALDMLPARPEEIWGEADDPDGDRPHRIFARVCDAAELPDSRDTRVRVMENTRPNVLSRKCPISFPPFQAAVAALVERANDADADGLAEAE